MSVAKYLKISNINGECREAAHKGWVQVEHADLSIQQNATARRSGGGNIASGEADFSNLTVELNLDSSYPKWAEACWLGTHLAEAQLDFTRSGGDKHIFHTYKFKNLLVTHVELVSSRANAEQPLVRVQLAYEQVNTEYFLTENEGGGVSGSVSAGFDLARRVAL